MSVGEMNTVGQLEINQCRFTWTLGNFSKIEGPVKSPIFPNAHSKIQFQILLYPFITSADDVDQRYISLYLYYYTRKEIKVYYEMIFSTESGIEIKKLTLCRTFNSKTSTWGWPKFLTRDAILQNNGNLLVNDTIHIICTIHCDVYSEEEIHLNKEILSNYESLFLNETLSDLTFIIENKEIKAHKNILAARSKVFAAMFSHNMEENNTNTVKIDDMNYDIMRDMLLFIYSGKVNNLIKNAIMLLPAAEKYDIKDLKILCEKTLWKNINIQNASETLKTADLYNCKELKDKIIDYIITNIKEVIKTDDLKMLNKYKPKLFEHIFTEVVERNI